MGAFSIGFSYNDWSKYKWDGWSYNKGKVDEYHVDAKYKNFKEEILEYEHIAKKQCENEVIIKANKYILTKVVKAISADFDVQWESKYGIINGTKISIDHLISVILYKDYTGLSSKFSSTSRKNGIFELLNTSKERNRKYAFWSKLLLETVQVYGQNSIYGRSRGDRRYIGDSRNKGELRVPFYCGMSSVMKLPQFHMYLESPTSTSLHIEVAMKFSGEQGCIIEFDNNISMRVRSVLKIRAISGTCSHMDLRCLPDVII